MVTGIISAEDPLTETILGTASDLGVSYYRMGYLSYDPQNLLRTTLKLIRRHLINLKRSIGNSEFRVVTRIIQEQRSEVPSGISTGL